MALHFSLSRFAVLVVVCLATQSILAETPAGDQRVRVKMGMPRKNGINPYFMALGWRADGGLEREASGIAYLNGPDQPAPDDGVTAAGKIVTAAHKALLQVKPSERGAVIEQAMQDTIPLPEVIYQNKAGFALTKIIERDDSNQTEKTQLSNSSFASAHIDLALDVFDIDLFNLSVRPKNSSLKLSIEGNPAVQIQTLELSTNEIEDQIVQALDAQNIEASVEGSPLTVDTAAEQRAMGMSFDGNEVDLPKLEAQSVTVDINDPTLSVITRLSFVKKGGMGLAMALLGLASVLLGAAGFFIVKTRREAWRRRMAG